MLKIFNTLKKENSKINNVKAYTQENSKINNVKAYTYWLYSQRELLYTPNVL